MSEKCDSMIRSERGWAATMARFYAPSICSMLNIIFVYFKNIYYGSTKAWDKDPFELNVWCMLPYLGYFPPNYLQRVKKFTLSQSSGIHLTISTFKVYWVKSTISSCSQVPICNSIHFQFYRYIKRIVLLILKQYKYVLYSQSNKDTQKLGTDSSLTMSLCLSLSFLKYLIEIR